MWKCFQNFCENSCTVNINTHCNYKNSQTRITTSRIVYCTLPNLSSSSVFWYKELLRLKWVSHLSIKISVYGQILILGLWTRTEHWKNNSESLKKKLSLFQISWTLRMRHIKKVRVMAQKLWPLRKKQTHFTQMKKTRLDWGRIVSFYAKWICGQKVRK